MTFGATAQDIHFSQFAINPLSYNPGMSGLVNSKVRASLTYRNQWPGVAPFVTTAGAVDGSYKFSKTSTALLTSGVMIYNDVAGDAGLKTFKLNAYFGTILPIDRNNDISVGLNGGLIQRSLPSENLIWDAQYVNGSYSSSNPTFENAFGYAVNRTDLGAGAAWRYRADQATLSSNDHRELILGVGAMHLLRPDISFSGFEDRLPVKVTGTFDLLYGLKNTNFSVRPTALYSIQGPHEELVAGLYWVISFSDAAKRTGFVKAGQFSLGSHIRVGDAFIPSIMFEVAEYKLAISYDTNYSGLKTATNGKGGIELTFVYTSPSSSYYRRNLPRGRGRGKSFFM